MKRTVRLMKASYERRRGERRGRLTKLTMLMIESSSFETSSRHMATAMPPAAPMSDSHLTNKFSAGRDGTNWYKYLEAQCGKPEPDGACGRREHRP